MNNQTLVNIKRWINTNAFKNNSNVKYYKPNHRPYGKNENRYKKKQTKEPKIFIRNDLKILPKLTIPYNIMHFINLKQAI